MKLISLALAAMASAVVVATPTLEAPKDTSANIDVLVRDDCKPCDDYYQKCRGSFWCWLNPVGCDISCRADACRNLDQCHNKCGYQC
jgi:hypothetical protein